MRTRNLTLAATLALVALPSSPVHADALGSPAMCAATFPARLADTKRAIAEQAIYMAEWGRVMPWFEQHCRMLTALERAVRKVDDPAAFVCDTAKGRPRELTSTFVAEHAEPLGIEIFQTRPHEHDLCAPHDAAERVSLVMRNASPIRRLEVMCWESDRPDCQAAREAIAAARRKGKT